VALLTTLRELRTAAWHGDRELPLAFPTDWDVSIVRPDTPAPLSEAEIAGVFEQPVGHPRISELARGKSRPLVIVDDLTRPTPADRVLPFVLRELHSAGVSPPDVTLLMAKGTHGAPSPDAMTKKVGPEAASSCRLLVHDDLRDVVKIGHTSFGTRSLSTVQCSAAISCSASGASILSTQRDSGADRN
jgi:lactate racemase